MEGLNQDTPDEVWHLPASARPEVEGPNSKPTNSRFDTSYDNYAAGGPPVPVISDMVIRAMENRRRRYASAEAVEISSPRRFSMVVFQLMTFGGYNLPNSKN